MKSLLFIFTLVVTFSSLSQGTDGFTIVTDNQLRIDTLSNDDNYSPEHNQQFFIVNFKDSTLTNITYNTSLVYIIDFYNEENDEYIINTKIDQNFYFTLIISKKDYTILEYSYSKNNFLSCYEYSDSKVIPLIKL